MSDDGIGMHAGRNYPPAYDGTGMHAGRNYPPANDGIGMHAGRNYPPTTEQPNAVNSTSAVKPNVDLKMAARQQREATKTQAVFNHGVADNKLLIEELKALGASSNSKIDPMPPLEINDEMKIKDAMKLLEEYRNEGKKQVKDLARTNVELASKIKEERKIAEYAKELWASAAPEPKEEKNYSIHYRVSYPRTPSQRTRLLIQPLHGAVAGVLYNQLFGAGGFSNAVYAGAAGALASHLFNQLRVTIHKTS